MKFPKIEGMAYELVPVADPKFRRLDKFLK